MAGIIIALFFFWLVVGLGLVIGAELNAALAEPSAVEDAEEDAGEGPREVSRRMRHGQDLMARKARADHGVGE